jgi:hypothetical protein
MKRTDHLHHEFYNEEFDFKEIREICGFWLFVGGYIAGTALLTVVICHFA